MHRYAEITSLIYPLQELQDRVSLEIPTAFLKEEGIREATDQLTAKYAVVYYTTADNEPDGDEMDVRAVLERLAKDVMSSYEIVWDIQHDERSRSTQGTTVSVSWPEVPPEGPREAMFRRANDAMDVVPLTIYADQNVYNITTDGNTFQILRNGQPAVQDAPSAQYALGALIPLLREELTEIENTNGMEPSPVNDFLAGLALSIIDTPEIPDEAKEHFVKFYELVTLRDFGAATEESE